LWTRNGEITHANQRMHHCGNLRDMFQSIVPANDARAQYSRVVPSLLVSEDPCRRLHDLSLLDKAGRTDPARLRPVFQRRQNRAALGTSRTRPAPVDRGGTLQVKLPMFDQTLTNGPSGLWLAVRSKATMRPAAAGAARISFII